MALTRDEQLNFAALIAAVNVGRICLMECTEKATGKRVPVVCTVRQDPEDQHIHMMPIAKLFGDENPFETLIPPDEMTGIG